jgi:xylan 1,4-beta-xylosidase
MLLKLKIMVAAALAAMVVPAAAPAQAPGTAAVYFDWFEYSGHDSVFDQPLPAGSYRNPILAGFFPDPAITRAGDAFYLVNSTFVYFPGIPVFKSTDLVHWRQIGNVIERASEIDFDGQGVSRGLFAPSITFHDGLFYVINTAVDRGGNYLATAHDPAGPWSDPIWLPQLEGAIDPSLFIDADGKAYMLNNGPPPGPPQYSGHRAIWIQAFDLGARKLVGPRKVLINGGVDFSKHPVWIEGPHLYHRGRWYYLMCAEGGTSDQHSEVVLRSRSPWGPFQPYAGNPILTQRDLPADRPDAIANAGHADLVEAADGSWWAVFLASRTYGKVHYNTGRETYLLPVTWHDGWPVILPHGKPIPYIVAAPHAAGVATQPAPSGPAVAASPAASPVPPTTGNFTWRDDFDAPTIRPEWLRVRMPTQPWADVQTRPGWLTIHALPEPLSTLHNPSFLARRQQHLSFDASVLLETPQSQDVVAGLAAFQSENAWYSLGVRRLERANFPLELFLEKRSGTLHAVVTSMPLKDRTRIRLKISGNGGDYSFYFDEDGAGWKPLTEHQDGSILSTDVAGGFTGAMIGPFAQMSTGRSCGTSPCTSSSASR